MSGPESPDAPPPEVPAEFADTYRDAYRRALESGGDDLPPVPPQQVLQVGTHRTETSRSPRRTDWRSAGWFLPAVIGASALALVAAAYVVGSAMSGDGQEPEATPSAAHPDKTRATGGPTSRPTRSSGPGSVRGAVVPVGVDAIAADCTAPPGNDSSGRRVTYVPQNAIDDRTQTAWRCDGTAVGQKLVLRLGADADVAQVGLIPGYAKTDPASGVDRYAENNRITRVRWTLGNGVEVVQRLDPDPSSRAVQVIRVPRTHTDTVTLEILDVRRGARNTTAISTLGVWAAR